MTNFFIICIDFLSFFFMNYKLYQQCPSASLLKQFIAMIYDSFLIASILFIGTAILLPFNGGEAVSGIYYSFYLLLLIFIFYSWFWNKSGQTLGMKVWKIRIINDYGINPSWAVCFLRLTFASLPPMIFLSLNRYFHFTDNHQIEAYLFVLFFLLGYLWRLFSANTWHDLLSNTKIIDISKLPVEKK